MEFYFFVCSKSETNIVLPLESLSNYQILLYDEEVREMERKETFHSF